MQSAGLQRNPEDRRKQGNHRKLPGTWNYVQSAESS